MQLAGLDDDEVENLYNGMEMSSFQLEKTNYETTLLIKIEDIKKHQARGKLIAIWRGKTNSDSPRDCSQIHKKSDLYEEAKLVFGTINEKSTPAYNVERALDILQKHEDILESFSSADSIDRAFQNKLLGRYAVVLKDIQSVRANLKETLGANVYDWYGHPDLQRVISKLAQGEYVRNCASRLAGEIDKMSADEAKKYLKKLVANQLEIGIEILSER